MTAPSSCAFPLFRQKFLQGARWTDQDDLEKLGVAPDSHPSDSSIHHNMPNSSGSVSLTAIHRSNLRNLDVAQFTPSEDTYLTESQAKWMKLQFFDKKCSEVGDCLFVGSESVAKNLELMREHGVTHIVNCVGFLYGELFKDDFDYKTLYLQDTHAEDILCLLYDVLEFIDQARTQNGRVLIHCSQGVSRSPAFAIAYLMWKLDMNYEESFQLVKNARGIVSPNVGFQVQLMNWHKRRTNPKSRRIYRVAPHCSAAPLYLVMKAVFPAAGHPSLQYLDCRGVFIIQTLDALYIWKGRRALDSFVEYAEKTAHHMAKFEGAPYPPIFVEQGQEPEDLRTAMSLEDNSGAAFEQSTSPPSPSSRNVSDYQDIGECDLYTADFDLYMKNAELVQLAGLASSISGLQPPVLSPETTEDDSVPASPGSSEGRMRKYRRSESERWDPNRLSQSLSTASEWPAIHMSNAPIDEGEPLQTRDDLVVP